ncbi:hypothetical protein SAMN04488082_111104 [Desulfomicrobium apsheronum]|uniref:Uncharacterized protein n=1 Tax=Desulfomicrobium apsheronum TaxID=52560 RepID=A0A1I3VYH4_9BACT|nr:hypothetical protein SAMN04488082_111104 [Desulfomicrobium apsheronum]
MNSGRALDREFWGRPWNRLSKCYEGLARKIGACNTHLNITLYHKLSKKLFFKVITPSFFDFFISFTHRRI